MRKYLEELTGTFLLVLIGTGAIVLHQEFGWIGHSGVSFAFGAIVCLMILAFGKSSGAHINPAVTLAFWVLKKISARDTLWYIVMQLLGATLASWLLLLLFPENELLGATIPRAGDETFALWLEFAMTGLLMFVILFSGRFGGITIPAILIGLTVGLEAYFGGPISGASMNPARSFGPAIVSGHTEYLWWYCMMTVGGAMSQVIPRKIFTAGSSFLAS